MEPNLQTLRRLAHANPGDHRAVRRFAHGLRRSGRGVEGFLTAFDAGVLAPDLEPSVAEPRLLEKLVNQAPCLRVASECGSRPDQEWTWPGWSWQPIDEFSGPAVLAVSLGWIPRLTHDLGELLGQLRVLRAACLQNMAGPELIAGLGQSQTLTALSCALPAGSDLRGVARLRFLKTLCLQTEIGERALEDLRPLALLEWLSLRLAEPPTSPPHFPALESLEVDGAADRRVIGMLCDARGLPRLERLGLNRLHCACEEDLRPISELSSLRTLRLSQGTWLR